MRILYNIITCICLLGSSLLANPCSDCVTSGKGAIQSDQSCCEKTKVNNSCCCSSEEDSCTCMNTYDEDQVSEKSIRYSPSKNLIFIRDFHIIDLDVGNSELFSFNFLLDRVLFGMIKQVSKILPLLN